MGVQAPPFTGTTGLQQDFVVEGTPLDFLNLIMAEEMMESTTCMYLSLSLPPSLSLSLTLKSLTRAINQPKRTTHTSVKLAGACEVINSRGPVEQTTTWPSGVICNVVSNIKIIYRNKVKLSSR